MAVPATEPQSELNYLEEVYRQHGAETALRWYTDPASEEEKAFYKDFAQKHGAEHTYKMMLDSLSTDRPLSVGEPVLRIPAEAAVQAQAPVVEQPEQKPGFRDMLRESLLQGARQTPFFAPAAVKTGELAGEVLEGPPYDVVGGMKLLARGLPKLPKQFAARLLASLQGHKGASVVDPGRWDRLIESADKDMEAWAKKAAKGYKGGRFLPGISMEDVATLPQSLAFSGVAMGGAAVTGGPIAAIPVPAMRPLGVLVGAGVSGGLAKNMASYEIMQEYLEAKNEESLAKRGKGITREEEKRLKAKFAKQADRYGLWEAVPEAVGNVAGFSIMLMPLKKMVGRTMATRIATKLAAMYGPEVFTEMVTAQGQALERQKAGLPGGRDVDWTSPTDWLTAFREVAGQTALLTTIMGGAGAGAVEIARAVTAKRAVQSLQEEIGVDDPDFQKFAEKIQEVPPTEEVAAEEAAEPIEGIEPETVAYFREKGYSDQKIKQMFPIVYIDSKTGKVTRQPTSRYLPGTPEVPAEGVVPAGRRAEEMPVAIEEIGPEEGVPVEGLAPEEAVSTEIPPPAPEIAPAVEPEVAAVLETPPVPEEAVTPPTEAPPEPIKPEAAKVAEASVEVDATGQRIADGIDATVAAGIQEAWNVPEGERPSAADILAVVGDAVPGKKAEIQAMVKRHGADAVVQSVVDALPSAQQPEDAVDALIRKNADELRQKAREEAQAGFMIRPTPKEAPAPEIEDPELKAALYAGRKRTRALKAFGQKIRDIGSHIAEFGAAEMDPQLKKSLPQFWDDYRTGALPVGMRAREKAQMALGGLWGDLNKKQRDDLMNLMGLNTFMQSLGEGLDIPRKLTLEVVQAELNRKMEKADPAVVGALNKYREFAMTVGEDLVARGKLAPEALKEFYFPHMVLDFLPEWWTGSPFKPRRVKQAFRPYTKKRLGSVRDIAISEDALSTHYATVFADNMMDDWALKTLEKYDLLPKLTKEQKAALGRIKPHGYYDVGETRYRGFQFIPGNMLYRAEAANHHLLVEALEDAGLDVERLLKKTTGEVDINRILEGGADAAIEYIISRPPAEQEAMLESYLQDVGPRGGNALRPVLAVGKYHRVYVVPEPMYEKMMRFKNRAEYVPVLHDLMDFTTFWKKLTLSPMGAGLPFQMRNLFGDAFNLYRANPGAARELGTSYRILRNLTTPEKLTPFEREVLKIVQEKDVLGAGFFREFTTVGLTRKPKLTLRTPISPRTWWGLYEHYSGMREGWMRVATAAYQLKRHKAGLPFKAPEFKNFIKDLDPESAVGYIARNFTVDYLDVPDFYRRYVRGFAFPFATFWQKNARHWAAYTRHAPGEFTAKFVAPAVAMWTYNNTGWRREMEENLGYFRRRPFHINLKAWDDDDDGKLDRGLVFAPETPLDMAAQFVGMDLLGDKVTLVRKGMMTPREAALTQLSDMGLATPRLLRSLTGPMIQLMDALATNRDPRTRQRIVPKELESLPDRYKAKYHVAFAIKTLATPAGQYMRGLDRKELSLLEQFTSPAHPLVRPVLRGPLDIFSGLGLYMVDLSREEVRDQRQILRESGVMYGVYMKKLEDAYVEGDMSPPEFMASQKARDIVADATQALVLIDPSGLLTRLASSRVQADFLEERLRKSTDPGERRKLERQIRSLDQLRVAEYLKTVPRGARPRALKKLMQKRKPKPRQGPLREGQTYPLGLPIEKVQPGTQGSPVPWEDLNQ